MKRSLILLVLIGLSTAMYASDPVEKKDSELPKVVASIGVSAFIIWYLGEALVPEQVRKAGYTRLFQTEYLLVW